MIILKRSELLAPAGDFNIAKIALYGGADALYLATPLFGARAYAKNLSFAELKDILDIAHVLGKKVYVTVNTIIKDCELGDVYDYLDKLYLLGVDAIIACDISVYMYIITNLSPMEAHISTQVGVKDLNDALFFEAIGANRVVIARETNIEEIKEIKAKAQIDLEVFIHGALCVSYSGGCLMSSMLSSRSGNRGRCSQNCRREYVLYQDGVQLSEKAFLLSMKDLCIDKKVNELQKIGVDSLKIEGRMKNSDYVKTVTSYYRNLLDFKPVSSKLIESIFHRPYTKGFLFNEDRGNITTITTASNEGRKIGKVLEIKNNYVTVKTDDLLQVGDRIRFMGDRYQYLTVKKLITLDHKEVTSAKGIFMLPLDFKLVANGDIYKMIDASLKNEEVDTNIIPITAFVKITKDEPFSITFSFNDHYFTYKGALPSASLTKPITEDSVFKQLNKLNDTPFYLDKMELNLDKDLYLPVSSLNEARRSLLSDIYAFYTPKRALINRKKIMIKEVPTKHQVIARCHTQAQYEACKEMGIETIFYQNVSPYVNSKYSPIREKEVLIASYGGINFYKEHELTADYSFNAINIDSVAHLINFGFKHVTVSVEASYNEVLALAQNFKATYGFKAPLDMVIYGHQTLMTLKCCPLKRFGLCGLCNKHRYTLRDDVDEFVIMHDECITHILNGHTLNLLEYKDKLGEAIDRFRLDFTIETKEETKEVLKALLNDEKWVRKNDTKGYFKRPIL